MCVHSRTLWVSPMNSPVRLGVSAAAATPQIFTARSFEALFPQAGILGCKVCLSPQLSLLAYLHMSVGHPYASSHLTQPRLPLLCCASFPSWLPISTPLTSLDEHFFFNSLVVGLPYSLIFLAALVVFCFSIGCYSSFGCVKKRSISTYASILARTQLVLFLRFHIYMKSFNTCLSCITHFTCHNTL